MIEQRYNLNLIPDKVPVMVRASQYDALSRTIIFNIFNGSELYEIPSGATVTVRGTKEDNTGFEYSCLVNGSEVSFEIQAQMTIFYGLVPCEIRITSGTEIIGSCNFQLNIEKTPLDSSTVISETQLPLLEEAIQAATDAQQSASAAAQSASQAEEVLSTAVKSVNGELPDASGNVEIDASGVPAGGTTGQILTKRSSTDGDADWENPLINYEITGQVPSGTPLNADQLQGHPASYFQQLLSAGSGIEINGNVISSLWNADLLWTNSSQSSSFSAQNISIPNKTSYRAFIITIKENTSSIHMNNFILLNNTRTLAQSMWYGSNSSKYYLRPVNAQTSSTDIVIGDCTTYSDLTSATTTTNNSVAIPLSIYGIK